MTLWRLEWLRLVRTRKLLALVGPYLFFGFVGPLTARYLADIIGSLGGEVTVVLPDPVPADGILQYSSNVQQIVLLVALILAAGALAFDTKPEISAFFRTRVRSVAPLLLTRYVVITAAIVAAYTLGALAAWYETVVLLGPLPAGPMLAGIAYSGLYLAFAVSVVALMTAVARSTLAAVALAVGALLSLPVLALLPKVGPWLPSYLAGAIDALAAGGDASEYLRAAGVAAALTALLLWFAIHRLQHREV